MATEIEQKGKNRIWWANTRYKGIRIRDSLKTIDREVALERLLEIKLLIKKGEYQKFKIKFEELASKYEPVIESKRKLCDLRLHILPAFEGKTLSECDVKKWAEKIALKHPYSTAVKILSTAKEIGLEVPLNKELPLQARKEWDDTHLLYEDQVLDVLQNYLSPRKYFDPCHVGMYSGLRRGNLIRLKKSDVDFKEGITVLQGRSKKHTVFIPMTGKLKNAFDQIKVRPLRDDDLWFPQLQEQTPESFSYAMIRAFKKAGLEWGSLHHLRHFFACYLVSKGVDIVQVSKMLGHRHIQTTMKYVRVDRETLKESARVWDAV